MLIIYRKQDGKIIDNQGINSSFPLGIIDTDYLIQYIIKQFGGKESDYGLFRLHDVDDIEKVEKTFTHEYSIIDNEIEFGELKPIPEPEPQPPSETEVMMDYLVDLDYRLTLVELGLA